MFYGSFKYSLVFTAAFCSTSIALATPVSQEDCKNLTNGSKTLSDIKKKLTALSISCEQLKTLDIKFDQDLKNTQATWTKDSVPQIKAKVKKDWNTICSSFDSYNAILTAAAQEIQQAQATDCQNARQQGTEVCSLQIDTKDKFKQPNFTTQIACTSQCENALKSAKPVTQISDCKWGTVVLYPASDFTSCKFGSGTGQPVFSGPRQIFQREECKKECNKVFAKNTKAFKPSEDCYWGSTIIVPKPIFVAKNECIAVKEDNSTKTLSKDLNEEGCKDKCKTLFTDNPTKLWKSCMFGDNIGKRAILTASELNLKQKCDASYTISGNKLNYLATYKSNKGTAWDVDNATKTECQAMCNTVWEYMGTDASVKALKIKQCMWGNKSPIKLK